MRIVYCYSLLGVALNVAGIQLSVNRVVDSFVWQNVFEKQETLAGFEATCEATATFPASQHLLADLNKPAPRGLVSWANAIKFFFGGLPFPGSWEGVDNEDVKRDIIMMEYTDVPSSIKTWIAEQQKDKENPNRFLFATYRKPTSDEDKINKLVGQDENLPDEDKVLMFAAGAIYNVLPIWVADESSCKDELLDLTRYKAAPQDGAVVAWVTEHSEPDQEATNKPSITFTVRAQVLKELESHREKRLLEEADSAAAAKAVAEEETAKGEEHKGTSSVADSEPASPPAHAESPPGSDNGEQTKDEL